MNREQVKKITFHLSKPLSFEFLRNHSKELFIFPFYHLVSEKVPAYIKYLYPSVTPGQFLDDLDFLLKFYQPASVDDLKEFSKNGKKSKKPFFFLSFDDGLKECYEIIYPILKEKGITAAFFINPDFVDNRNLFYRFKTSLIVEAIQKSTSEKMVGIANLFNPCNLSKKECAEKILALSWIDDERINQIARLAEIDFDEVLKTEKPYMTLDQLNQLNNDGFIIGAHSMNHPLFSEMDESRQIKQAKQSLEFIKEKFRPEISTFAFPFTDFGVAPSVFHFLNDPKNADLTFGTAGIKLDSSSNHIQRIPMENENRRNAGQIIRTEYAYFILKSVFGKNKISRNQ